MYRDVSLLEIKAVCVFDDVSVLLEIHKGKKLLRHTYKAYDVPNCYRTANPKFHFEMLPFNSAQGLRVPQQNLIVTLKCAVVVKTFLEPSPG